MAKTPPPTSSSITQLGTPQVYLGLPWWLGWVIPHAAEVRVDVKRLLRLGWMAVVGIRLVRGALTGPAASSITIADLQRYRELLAEDKT